MHRLKIGISPCPNDTFIFENLYNGKIVIPNVTLDWEFHDIEELNILTSQGYFDIVKVSFAHLHNLTDRYRLLNSGGAMGYGVGPILVKRKDHEVDFSRDKVAIPGKNTTANFLLTTFFPELRQKDVVLFSDIEESVLNGKYDLGLLIHEGRFTYQAKGLDLVHDLGDLWQRRENLPIPLGSIVALRSLGDDLLDQIQEAISRSITNYDKNNRPVISDFIIEHAQEMSPDVIVSHIDLYVNDFSIDMGKSGQKAIARMHELIVQM
jgi:1,4-dihydroxy-6-naphthoate synthase